RGRPPPPACRSSPSTPRDTGRGQTDLGGEPGGGGADGPRRRVKEGPGSTGRPQRGVVGGGGGGAGGGGARRCVPSSKNAPRSRSRPPPRTGSPHVTTSGPRGR